MSTQIIQQVHDPFRVLRRALQGNGTFSAMSGLVLAFGSKSAAAFLGLDAAPILLGMGVVLLLYAVDLFWVASRPEIDRRLGWTAVILDIVWVIASYALLLGGWLPLTVAGKWAIALIAEVVGIFAIWQYIGLRRT